MIVVAEQFGARHTLLVAVRTGVLRAQRRSDRHARADAVILVVERRVVGLRRNAERQRRRGALPSLVDERVVGREAEAVRPILPSRKSSGCTQLNSRPLMMSLPSAFTVWSSRTIAVLGSPPTPRPMSAACWLASERSEVRAVLRQRTERHVGLVAVRVKPVSALAERRDAEITLFARVVLEARSRSCRTGTDRARDCPAMPSSRPHSEMRCPTADRPDSDASWSCDTAGAQDEVVRRRSRRASPMAARCCSSSRGSRS